jgi:hypothetical protein
MRVTCENCHTVYEFPRRSECSPCPYCDHLNLVPEAAEPPPMPTTPPKPPRVEEQQSPSKTLVFAATAAPEVPASESAAPAPSSIVSGAKMELIVLGSGGEQEHHTLTRLPVTIGRGLCDVRVRDPEASREHCTIALVDDRPVLKDLQSANGTLLNGQLIREQPLADGDVIQVGTTQLRFRVS